MTGPATAAGGGPLELREANPAQEEDGAEAGVSSSGCLPRFSSPRLLTSPGYFSRLTPKTRDALGSDNYVKQLAAMRDRFPGHPDHDMAPFLRIHHGNLDQSIASYESCLSWRAATLPVSRESCGKELASGRFYFHGTDLQGRPIAYLTMRGHDPKHRDLGEVLRAMVYVCEKLIDSLPPKEFQVTVVLDRHGTTVKNQDGEMMRHFFDLFSHKYPNKLAKVLVCPANMVFRTLWAALKYAMPERVRAKVIMCQDRADLLHHISPEQLLASLGGRDPFVFDADQV